MATYSLRGPNGRFKCVPEYPRKRKSDCGCALGGSHPCPIHRPSDRVARKLVNAPARRVALDAELREEYQDHWLELDAARTGLQYDIDTQVDALSTDVYDQGMKVDYRHHAKGKKAFTPTGKRVTHRPEIAFDTAIRAAEARLRRSRADLREVKREIAEVETVLRRGYILRPEGYRAALGAARTRAALPLTRRSQRSRYARR